MSVVDCGSTPPHTQIGPIYTVTTITTTGMAYATLSSLPPIYGLYASTIAGYAYALFGTSGQLTLGPVALVRVCVLCCNRHTTVKSVLSAIDHPYTPSPLQTQPKPNQPRCRSSCRRRLTSWASR